MPSFDNAVRCRQQRDCVGGDQDQSGWAQLSEGRHQGVFGCGEVFFDFSFLFLASLSSSPRSYRLERTLVSDKRLRVHFVGIEGLTGLATI